MVLSIIMKKGCLNKYKWIFGALSVTLLLTLNHHLIFSKKTDAAKPDPYLKVYLIDVGQGEAIFIDIFKQYRILIDSGPFKQSNYSFYKKKRGIHYFLNKHNIKVIDQYILSHPHHDHIGGLKKILNSVIIKQVLDPGFAYPSKDYEDCLTIINRKKIPYKIVRRGMKYAYGEVAFEILSPRKLLKFTRSNANNNAIVLKMTYQNISFLFTSDIEQETETLLLPLKNKLRSTFLKVPHQGSQTSSTVEFLKLVNAKAAFISCKKNNIFGHPAPETLKKFKKMNIPIYRTDIHGTIMIKTDGHSYQIKYDKSKKTKQIKN